MQKIEAIIKPFKLDDVKEALNAIGISGMTLSEVKGYGRQKGHIEHYRGLETKVNLLPKLMLQIVCHDRDKEPIISALVESARTGEIGDGKIFVLPIEQAVRIRSGETGEAAIG